ERRPTPARQRSSGGGGHVAASGFGLVGLQGWQDSNPRPTVLETAALPAELHPFAERHSIGGQEGSRSSRASGRPESSVSSTVARGSLGSSSRLIQIDGSPISEAGAMSWKRLAPTWTWRPCDSGWRASNRRQCPGAGL